MNSYVLMDNKSYDLKGVYYGGVNKKYHDMFNITVKECAKVFECMNEAKKTADNLNMGGYYFEVVPVCNQSAFSRERVNMEPADAIKIIMEMDKGITTEEENEAFGLAYAAMVKQIKKKVKISEYQFYGRKIHICPSCQEPICPRNSKDFCQYCGQRISWEN